MSSSEWDASERTRACVFYSPHFLFDFFLLLFFLLSTTKTKSSVGVCRLWFRLAAMQPFYNCPRLCLKKKRGLRYKNREGPSFDYVDCLDAFYLALKKRKHFFFVWSYCWWGVDVNMIVASYSLSLGESKEVGTRATPASLYRRRCCACKRSMSYTRSPAGV